MCKSFFLLIVYSSIFLCEVVLAQDSHSIQINGGIISPRSSSNGLVGSIQYNYSFNTSLIFYAYMGYSAWDRNKVVLHNIKEVYTNKSQHYFYSYSEDEHYLIPVYIGTSIDLHTNKLFTSFLEFEIGYSYLSYISYENVIVTDPESGEVLSYYADGSTGENVQENLFGVGIGAGLSHPISSGINLLLTFKLNSYVNENYYGLFSKRGTYTTFLAGFNFNL